MHEVTTPIGRKAPQDYCGPVVVAERRGVLVGSVNVVGASVAGSVSFMENRGVAVPSTFGDLSLPVATYIEGEVKPFSGDRPHTVLVDLVNNFERAILGLDVLPASQDITSGCAAGGPR